MRHRTYLITLSFVFGLTIVSACESAELAKDWNFEDRTFQGWNVSGTSFSLSQETRYANHGYYMQEGDVHIVGTNVDIGVLRSPSFTLAGTGNISFLMSGAPSASGAYLGIFKLDDDAELMRIQNEHYHEPPYAKTYLRYIVDLCEYLGEKLYLKAVDASATETINIDDVLVDIDEAMLAELDTDRLVRLGITSAPDMRQAADTYIRLNALKIDEEKRFAFHLTGETGWINDPNGFSEYDNNYHLFYQHNPYATSWGPMHWGHVTSTDFVKWQYQDIAIAPDRTYDSVGAFSGSAIEWKGKYYLLYTGASVLGQVQCLAISEDGIHFEKYENNPVIDEDDLPADTTIRDFRDPKVFVRGDWVYSVISARNESNEYSKLLLYKTQDMINWQYAGRLFANSANSADRLGVMMECPDLISIDNQDVLIVSPQTVTGHRNNDGNVYLPGTMNWVTGALNNIDLNNIEEIDGGFDFYAPQTMKTIDGRTIMIAWMAGWSRRPITSEFGFAGAMTFPRELSFVNGHLFQNPVEELEDYRTNPYMDTLENITVPHYNSAFEGIVKDIEVTFTPGNGKTGITVFDDGVGNNASIYYENGRLYLERFGITDGYYPTDDRNNKTSVALPLVEGQVKLRILLDMYSIEVFGADGYRTITATGMPKTNQNKIGFFADYSTDFSISVYDLAV